MLGSVNYWAWHPHPEVWVLVVGLLGLGFYASRVIGPKIEARGGVGVTRGQKCWFALGLVLLEVAADWPMHDIGENYLYSVHMAQHMLLTFVIPPVFLLATPTWLAELILGRGRFNQAVRWLARPVQAAVIFNALQIFTHWPAVVNHAVASAPLHFGLHAAVVASALLLWMPVCGPLPELRISLPAQMVYLFLTSIIPTVPAAWLTLADGAVYKAYDIPDRMFGISVTSDQQAAGLLMKLGGGTYLWVLITMLFFRWANRHEAAERAGRLVINERDLLTYRDVEEAFEAVGPARQDPTA